MERPRGVSILCRRPLFRFLFVSAGKDEAVEEEEDLIFERMKTAGAHHHL